MKDEDQGGISLEDIKKESTACEWFDKFLMDHVNSKKKEFQMIIRGLYRAIKAGESGEIIYENLRERVTDMLKRTLVERNFTFPSPDDKESWASINLQNYCYNLGTNKQLKFSGVLNSIIATCLKEGRDKPKDRI